MFQFNSTITEILTQNIYCAALKPDLDTIFIRLWIPWNFDMKFLLDKYLNFL